MKAEVSGAKENEKRDTEAPVKKKMKIGAYVVLALAFLAFYFLLKFQVIEALKARQVLLQKFSLAGFFAAVILMSSKLSELLIARRARSKSDRYNLIRVIRLGSILLIIVVAVSFIFVNWYAAAVSLGLISLILGFALQTPITSFIGWINILIRRPYRVGDRIQVDTFKGDVVEINYLDTTLWEFGGDYLTNDVPSGRLIRFPNSLVLEAAVFNYSWRKFPFIWNEIPFHVAYESDLDHVAGVIREVAKNELGDEMEERIRRFKTIVKQSPVDELDIREYPFVSLRISTNTWVEVLLTYLVEPRKAAAIRTRLIRNIITELLKQPDKVMFPKSNAR